MKKIIFNNILDALLLEKTARENVLSCFAERGCSLSLG